MSRYLKALLAALGAVATWGITAGADEGYTDVELYGLLGAIVTSLTVYAFPNRPPSGELSDPEISEQGAVNVLEALILVFIVVVILVVLGVV